MTPKIDYAGVFASLPSPCVVLSTDLVIADANAAFCEATGRSRAELVGQYLFDAFPDNPVDSGADGVVTLKASLHRVLSSRQTDHMALQKYDIPVAGNPEVFKERWWTAINVPVLGPDGKVTWIIHRSEDMTDVVRARDTGHPPSISPGREAAMEAELYARARQLQQLNEELRQAHARERRIAVALQEAMLHSPDLARHPNIAVRYLPATGSLNVCGDWYDAVDLPADRFTVAVGDVVGHGLMAATVMGRLRSALSAATRTVHGPAQALEVLGLYARSVEGALAATAVQVLVDCHSQLLIYSSAGHPPPVLLHPDGSCDLLDQATDPPLGARPEHVPRPQANATYTPGDTLVLYTDGLIERRGEDIDDGLARLTSALATCTGFGAEHLADALLARLGVTSGADDDIAMVVVRLNGSARPS
ncbi:SpoIIE family protein phosphatase [Streptomyces sp. 5-8]|uniref:SpoIIE family protein phosphatase n=1 Tax=Streptomyces musisoli TaxID=2802280 RepID=A0ABS1PD57_9ACTN|nr:MULTISPECIES: SpoIIE family protein phosphatase [Streptomyces]MBL1110100.1 SpoIIE family protein phosphatase [Streptomyces musisoli]MBY8845948.1 SpoIIE family protein phosphatase [Streptomyces sp. SP2-10]